MLIINTYVLPKFLPSFLKDISVSKIKDNSSKLLKISPDYIQYRDHLILVDSNSNLNELIKNIKDYLYLLEPNLKVSTVNSELNIIVPPFCLLNREEVQNRIRKRFSKYFKIFNIEIINEKEDKVTFSIKINNRDNSSALIAKDIATQINNRLSSIVKVSISSGEGEYSNNSLVRILVPSWIPLEASDFLIKEKGIISISSPLLSEKSKPILIGKYVFKEFISDGKNIFASIDPNEKDIWNKIYGKIQDNITNVYMSANFLGSRIQKLSQDNKYYFISSISNSDKVNLYVKALNNPINYSIKTTEEPSLESPERNLKLDLIIAIIINLLIGVFLFLIRRRRKDILLMILNFFVNFIVLSLTVGLNKKSLISLSLSSLISMVNIALILKKKSIYLFISIMGILSLFAKELNYLFITTIFVCYCLNYFSENNSDIK